MNSGLVKDIQMDILENKDIVSILRKSLVLAQKLNLAEFEYLIKKELNGYSDSEKIPEYRIIKGYRILGWNPYSGWILANIDNDKLFNLLTTMKMYESVSIIEEFAQKGGEKILPTEYMSKFMNINTQYKVCIAKTEFINIIEYLKNFILETCVNLEKEGICGSGISFSKEEVEVAKNISQITNIFNGAINSSNLQISSDNSNQSMKINDLNIDNIKRILLELNKYNEQIIGLPNGQKITERLELLNKEVTKNDPDNKFIEEGFLFIKNSLSGAGGNLIATGILELLKNVF